MAQDNDWCRITTHTVPGEVEPPEEIEDWPGGEEYGEEGLSAIAVPGSDSAVLVGELHALEKWFQHTLDAIRTAQQTPAGPCKHCGEDVVATRGPVHYWHAHGKVSCRAELTVGHEVAEAMRQVDGIPGALYAQLKEMAEKNQQLAEEFYRDDTDNFADAEADAMSHVYRDTARELREFLGIEEED